MPRSPQVASTVESLTAYVFTPLRERIRKHPGPLLHLHIGDTWLLPPEPARADALSSTHDPALHRYAPVQGMPELLEAFEAKVLRRTGVRLDPEAIQVTAGATGGLSTLTQALLDPGDEVLLPAPYWPLFPGIVNARGGVPVELPFYDHLGEPGFDAEAALEARVTPRTAAIYLNSPHNPTGRVIDDAVAAAVARVAERHGLWVFTDEVYEDLWFTDEAPQPLWCREDLRHRTFAIHSMSKGYALAGARVGFVHGPTEPMVAVRAAQTFSTYCAARPMQLLAAHALNEGDAWLANTRALYKDAGRRAAAALGLAEPQGGTFLFFDASPWLDGGDSALPLLERCIDRGVVITPGLASGKSYGRWARLCFTTLPPAELDRALELLSGLMPR